MTENTATIIPIDIGTHKSGPTEDTFPLQEAFFAFNLLGEKLRDAQTPAYLAEFDPVEAEEAGAFYEDALSELDAFDSAYDFQPFVAATSPLKT